MVSLPVVELNRILILTQWYALKAILEGCVKENVSQNSLFTAMGDVLIQKNHVEIDET